MAYGGGVERDLSRAARKAAQAVRRWLRAIVPAAFTPSEQNRAACSMGNHHKRPHEQK